MTDVDDLERYVDEVHDRNPDEEPLVVQCLVPTGETLVCHWWRPVTEDEFGKEFKCAVCAAPATVQAFASKRETDRAIFEFGLPADAKVLYAQAKT